MIRRDLAWWINVARALVALLAAIGVISIGAGNPAGLTTDTKTTTTTSTTTVAKVIPPAPEEIKVDTADADAKPDTVAVSESAQDVAEVLAVGAAEGTNDLQPKEPGEIPLVGDAPIGPVAQLKPPFASDSVPGCRTRTFTNNWSYRQAGIQVATLDLHYTAGPDKPHSRADVDGLTAFGNQASSRVSWHINMDKDGNCDYNVPYRYKAWTIGNLNSASVNIEVAGQGEAPYLRSGGYKELARIFVDLHRSYPLIELRLAAYRNCTVTRSGVGTHWMGGSCSGGHVDINPLSIQAVISQLRGYVAKLSCNKRCRTTKALKAKHHRTHDRFRKNRCKGKTAARYGYCNKLRARNKQIHARARKAHIRL